MMRGAWLASAALAIGACQSAGVQPDVPAVIADSGPDALSEVRQIVSTAMHGAEVRLADDALTGSSELLLENSAPQGLGKAAGNGRNPGRPERFQLVLDGSQCTLVQQSTGLRWLLLDTSCRAL